MQIVCGNIFNDLLGEGGGGGEAAKGVGHWMDVLRPVANTLHLLVLHYIQCEDGNTILQTYGLWLQGTVEIYCREQL